MPSQSTMPDRESVRPSASGRSADTHAGGLHSLITIVRKQIWIALAVALAVIIGAAAYGLTRKKIYRAEATLQIDPKPPAPLGRGVESVVEVGAASFWATQEYYNTQHKLITSKPTALIAVRNLGLNQDPKFIANTIASPEEPIKPVSPEEAADMLIERLSVTPIKESRLVEVSFDDADKLRAVRVLEAVIQAYVEHNVNQTVESTSAAAAWLGEQLTTLRSELGTSELALHKYKLEKQIPTIGLEDQASVLLKEMGDLTAARTDARTRMQKAAARLAQLKKIDADKPDSIPQTELLQSHELENLRTDFITAQKDVIALKGAGKGENHPEMVAAQSKLSITSNAISAEVRNIVTGVEQELAAIKQEEGGLSALLKAAEEEALDLNLMEIEYTRLKRTKDNNEKLYSLVLERSKEANLTQMLRVNNVKVLSRAEAQKNPVEPKLPFILATATLFGLALGAGAGWLRERSDRTIKSPAELEERFRLTSLGTIPVVGWAGAKQGHGGRRANRPTSDEGIELLPLKDPKGAVAEAVRNIRTNILFMSPDRPFKRLLITSAGPAEGKTTLACHIGIAMAQTGQRVLLVDCDMRRPRIHNVFPKRDGAPTVSSSLLDSKMPNLALLSTEVENLSVMNAGPTPPNPAELLHSQTFHQLLDRLSDQFDLVLIDSPPLVVTDAAIISTLVDGTLLVVRALKTEFSSVQGALRAVKDVGGRVVGTILNGARNGSGRDGYGYYGYGVYSAHGGHSAEKVSNERSAEA